MTLHDEELLFTNEFEESELPITNPTPVVNNGVWKVLIVDDEAETHSITKLVLNDFIFENKPLQIISAYSGEEAKTLITQHPDFAVILLDVVMETEHTGLQIVKFIRNTLQNRLTRIILRTDQPGQAPEAEIIKNYDINDYKDKTELTSQKLIILLYSALRSYNDVKQVAESKRIVEYFYKTTVEKLSRSKKHIFNIIDSMPSVLIGIDNDLKVTDWNLQAKEMTGLSYNEANGKNLLEIFPYVKTYLSLIQQTLQEHVEQKAEKVTLDFNNSSRHFDLTIYPITLGDSTGAVIRLDDITTQLMMENILAQSEKMATISGLINGMAHDIKNPLGIIIQNTQNIVNRLDLSMEKNKEVAQKYGLDLEKLHAYLEERQILKFLNNVRFSVENALMNISNMLGFSRNNDYEKDNINIKIIIDNAIDFVCKDLNLQSSFDFQKHHVQVTISDEVGDIFCSKDQLTSVVFNLLKNSAQAITEDNLNPIIGVKAYIKDNLLTLKVYDNGKGMDEEVQEKLFKPFSATKAHSRSYGLGLSICNYIITELHHGTIAVQSKPNEGCAFFVRLPLTQPNK